MEGLARAFDLDVAARFIIGMIWSGSNSELSDNKAIIDAVTDFTLRGLAPGGAP